MNKLFNVESRQEEPIPFGMTLGDFRRMDFDTVPELPMMLPADPSAQEAWYANLDESYQAVTAELKLRSEAATWREIGDGFARVMQQIEAGDSPEITESDFEELRDCFDSNFVVAHCVATMAEAKATEMLRNWPADSEPGVFRVCCKPKPDAATVERGRIK